MRGALARFQAAIKSKHLSGALVAAPEELSSTNLRYLSGFSGSSAYLLITPDHAWILTDFRYLDQAKEECPDFTVVRHTTPVAETLSGLCREQGIFTLGWEADKVPYQMWEQWNATVPVVWKPLDRLIESQRIIKDDDEIARLAQAARIAGESLQAILPGLVGRREIDLAIDLEVEMRRRGAEALGFSTIVGAGERGALPHAHPSQRVIGAGELVTIDFGAQVDGYKSDETITVATGEITPELRKIWDVVAEAQRRGIAQVKPGNTSRQVDSAVRDYIREQGYGEHFGHGTGHGVGLDIHEEPFASQNPQQDRTLEAGMTITVEPGIYLAGIGGVRLEDTLLVTEQGAERLTIVPKHFQVFG